MAVMHDKVSNISIYNKIEKIRQPTYDFNKGIILKNIIIINITVETSLDFKALLLVDLY